MTKSYAADEIKKDIDNGNYLAAEKKLNTNMMSDSDWLKVKKVIYVLFAYAPLNALLFINIYCWAYSVYALFFGYIIKKNQARVGILGLITICGLGLSVITPIYNICMVIYLSVTKYNSQGFSVANHLMILISSIIFVSVIAWAANQLSLLNKSSMMNKGMLSAITENPDASLIQSIAKYGFITTIAIVYPGFWLEGARRLLNIGFEKFWRPTTGLSIGCVVGVAAFCIKILIA